MTDSAQKHSSILMPWIGASPRSEGAVSVSSLEAVRLGICGSPVASADHAEHCLRHLCRLDRFERREALDGQLFWFGGAGLVLMDQARGVSWENDITKWLAWLRPNGRRKS